VSLRARIKRLETQVEWLDENGELRLLEIEWKLLQMKEQISARDPVRARRLGFLPPLPVPVTPPPEPTKPHPEEPSAARRQGAFERLRSKRPEGSEPAPPVEPTLRDAALRAAPQGEEVRVELPVVATPPPPPKPPEPEPVKPFTYDPPPEMQIRPVFWRKRGTRDYEDDEDDMYGKCIVDYDPLGYLDTDDDD
jgi:hypothetical protein